MSAAIEQRNQDATCYVGGLDERVNEELLWELMIQANTIDIIYTSHLNIKHNESFIFGVGHMAVDPNSSKIVTVHAVSLKFLERSAFLSFRQSHFPCNIIVQLITNN